MGLVGLLRWTNAPPTGALEMIAHGLVNEHQAVPLKQKNQVLVSCHRANYPANPSSVSAPTINQPHSERLLLTVSSPNSPYVHALLDDPSVGRVSVNPPSAPADPESEPPSNRRRKLMFSLTPPHSLTNLLASLKSPFLIGNLNQVNSTKQGIDMGGGSADRAGKPKTNNVRIEGLCFELPSEIASFDGKRASEWKISVGYLSGTSGSSTRGIVLEVEHLLEPESMTAERLNAFMISLLPPLPDLKYELGRMEGEWAWSAIGISEPIAGTSDAVESAKRGSYMLISMLRREGII